LNPVERIEAGFNFEVAMTENKTYGCELGVVPDVPWFVLGPGYVKNKQKAVIFWRIRERTECGNDWTQSAQTLNALIG